MSAAPRPALGHSSAGDLVRAIARSNQLASSHFRTVLAHVEDRRGVLEVLLRDTVLKNVFGLDNDNAWSVEAFACDLLGTSLHGLTFSIKAGRDPRAPSAPTLRVVPPELLRAAILRSTEPAIPKFFDRASFATYDTARGSRSVFDGTEYEEFLVQLPVEDRDGAGPTSEACFRDCAIRVVGLAKEMDRPLSYVHAPVGAPTALDVPRDVTGRCLRIGVAFPRFDDSSRLRFGNELVKICVGEGYRLWQHGHANGETRHDYWQLVVPGGGRARADSEPRSEPQPDGDPADPGRGLAITCLGPTHLSSTHAILRILDRAGAPLHALATTTLDDITLVHLVTSAPGAGTEMPSVPDADAPAGAVLSRVLASPEPPECDGLEDFRAIVSPRVQRRTGRPLAALWLSWATPARFEALRQTILTLGDALEAASDYWGRSSPSNPDGHFNLEYLVCRQVAADQLHGRMKVAVDLEALDLEGVGGGQWPGCGPAPVLPAKLGKFCSDVEHRWRMLLSSALGTTHVELDVVWRESWIGRWAGLGDRPAHLTS